MAIISGAEIEPIGTPQVPEDFRDEVRDVLAHFYDYPYLLRHPILQRFGGLSGVDPPAVVQKLRRVFIEAIEELRPQDDTPPSSLAWRPYAVLYNRYVLGKELEELETKLLLGKRQIQREQHKAFEYVVTTLWNRQARPFAERAPTRSSTTLSEEISRLVTDPEVFDAGCKLDGALDAVRSLAVEHRVSLTADHLTRPIQIVGDPFVFRQLLVAAFSFGMRQASGGVLNVALECKGKEVLCSIALAGSALTSGTTQKRAVPEPLAALADAQGAQITQEINQQQWKLTIKFRAAQHAGVVAIIEDNPDLVALFSRYLSKQGYELVVVNDSTTALERLTAVIPDIVVLDVMMREVDGWEILQRLRKDARLSKVPVVICSVLDEPELARSLGAEAYLRKPVRPAQLRECLARLLRLPRSGAATP